MRSKPPGYEKRKAEALAADAPPPSKKRRIKTVAIKKPWEPKAPKEPKAAKDKVVETGKHQTPRMAEVIPPAMPRVAEGTAPASPTSSDDMPLARVVADAKKRKEYACTLSPLSPRTRARLANQPIKMVEIISWTTSTEESSSTKSTTATSQQIQDNSPEPEIPVPSPMPTEVPAKDLPQEPVLPDEVPTAMDAEETSRESHGDEAEALPTRTDDDQINADAELAKKMAEEEFAEDELNQSREAILRAEQQRVRTWQQWRMSGLPTLTAGLELMWDEEAWALEWMGTTNVFAATRPEEIDRVFNEKLTQRDARKGKGRATEEEINPRERARAESRILRRVQLLSKFQEQFVDRSPGVGTSRAAEATPTVNADDSQPDEAQNELQMAIFQDTMISPPHSPEVVAHDNEDEAIPTDPAEIPAAPAEESRPSPSLARDETMEASRGASQEDIEPTELDTIQTFSRPNRSSAGDGTREASPRASHDGVEPRTHSSPSHEGKSDVKRVLSSIALLKFQQDKAFKEMKKTLRHLRKESKKGNSEATSSSRSIAFEESVLAAQANNEKMFHNILEGLTDTYKELQESRVNQQRLQEQLDLSCIKLDLINENVTNSASTILSSQYEMKDLKLMINELTKLVTSALDDANKGEEIGCKDQAGQQSRRGRDGDDEGRGGRREHPQAYPRAELSMPPASKSSAPAPRKDQPRTASTQRTTLTAEGRLVPYEPYEEGSGLRFRGCNIPPNLKSKSNQQRQDYQRQRNIDILKAKEQKERAEAEALQLRNEDLERFKKMKEEVEALELVRRTSDDQIKFHALIQYMKMHDLSFFEGMNAAEFNCWWNRRVLDGHNIIVAAKNYFEFIISKKYQKYVKDHLPIRGNRKEINDKLDRKDAKERKRQEQQKK